MRDLSGKKRLAVVALFAAMAFCPPAASAATGFGAPVDLPWLQDAFAEFTAGAPGEVIVSAGRQDPRPDGSTPSLPVVAVLAPGHDDAAPQVLSDDGIGAPAVAANRSGQAIAAWADVNEDQTGYELNVVSRAAGELFGSPTSQPDLCASPIEAAMNDGGDAVIVCGSTSSLEAVFRSADGQLSAPMNVGEGGPHGSGPLDVAVDEAGNATVAWYAGDGPDQRLRVATGNRNSGFGATQMIESAPTHWTPPQVEVDAQGGTAIVWDDRQYAHVKVMTRASPQDPFSEPQDLGYDHTSGLGPQLEVAPDGRTLVLWKGARAGYGPDDQVGPDYAYTEPESDSKARVDIGTTRGGAFVRFYDGRPSSDMDLPAMGIDAAGNAAFVYMPVLGYSPSPNHQLLVTTGPIANGFGDTHEVACPAGPPGLPHELLTWSPDEMAVVLRQYHSSGQSYPDYSMIRTVPGTEPGPEYCIPPEVYTPPAVAISAPPAAKLRRLRVTVSTKGSGHVRVSGHVALKGGKRLGTFKAVRWATKGATKRRLRLRFAGREGWIRRLGHHRALARVEVVLKDARGKTRKRVARVQVRR